MPLNLDSLDNALKQLSAVVAITEDATYMDNQEKIIQENMRAGAIQHFECAYELSWKFIQRWLKENRDIPEAQFPRTRKELFRMAANSGLISDPLPWFKYSDVRNISSHTYDVDKAHIVYQASVEFSEDGQQLLEKLIQHND